MRLIDADALLDRIHNPYEQAEVARWVNLMPTIEERKKGKWISADAIFGGVPFYCSECGENTLDTVMGKPRWNYCPMCGADMRKVKKNEP